MAKGELIKRKEGYYVPWDYEFWDDTHEPRETDEIEDACACPPTISFNNEVGKWELSFTSADGGGYDVQVLEYYFDSEQDAIDFVVKKG